MQLRNIFVIFAVMSSPVVSWHNWRMNIALPGPEYPKPGYHTMETISEAYKPYPPLFSLALKFLSDGARFTQEEFPEINSPLAEYDFIIVGGGSAGCVLANRLSENATWKILLVEAGESENFVMGIPVTTHYLQFTHTSWKYQSLPSHFAYKGMIDGRMNMPAGKCMGGSSAINHMVYMRGNRKDYDTWAQMGNPGWGWDDVLPYFKKSEDSTVQWKYKDSDPDQKYDPEFHGIGGYQTVSRIRYFTKAGRAFHDGAEELGVKSIDYNSENNNGISYTQVTMKDGMRMSANRAFLHPIKYRRNLHVLRNTRVTKIMIHPQTLEAMGIEYKRGKHSGVIRATKEVILSAGAIGSPHLLMLSGVGPKKNLKSVGIKVLKKLPVGMNLMDHPMVIGVTYLVNTTDMISQNKLVDDPFTIGKLLGPRSGANNLPSGMQLVAMLNSKNLADSSSFPDIEIQYIASTMASDHTLPKSFNLKKEITQEIVSPLVGKYGFMAGINILKPKSRGRVFLNSSNPYKHPYIYTGCYEEPEDRETMVDGIMTFIKLAETSKMVTVNATLYDKKLSACKSFDIRSREYWLCFIRYMTATNYHYCGTCKMGPESDPTAVVSPELKVHGISKLRVVDASIMPEIPSAHTNSPTQMIAEKASDMIKQTWGSSV